MAVLRSAILASLIVSAGWTSTSASEVKDALDKQNCKQPVLGAALALRSDLAVLLDSAPLRLAHLDLRRVLQGREDRDVDHRLLNFGEATTYVGMIGSPYSGLTHTALVTYAGIDVAITLFNSRACAALADPDTTGSIGLGVGSVVRAGAALASVAGEAAQGYAAAASAALRSAAAFKGGPLARALTLRGHSAPIQWALLDIPNVPGTTTKRSGTIVPGGGGSAGGGPTRGGIIPTPGPIVGAGLPVVLACVAAMVCGRRQRRFAARKSGQPSA